MWTLQLVKLYTVLLIGQLMLLMKSCEFAYYSCSKSLPHNCHLLRTRIWTNLKSSPWGLNDPTEGSRKTITDPWDNSASPFSWISTGQANYSTTRGNNGIAQSNPTGGSGYLYNYRPNSTTLDFSYKYDETMSPPSSYIDASIVQLFYTANTYHDLLYELGFNEQAGNFEYNNNGKGGKDKDYVILNAQDGVRLLYLILSLMLILLVERNRQRQLCNSTRRPTRSYEDVHVGYC
jgi:hypothetical protein